MFAHQVIDDLSTIVGLPEQGKNEVSPKMAASWIATIRESHQFYLGERGDIVDIQRHQKHKNGACDCKPLFHGDLAVNVRLPYPKCWFDYSAPSKPHDPKPNGMWFLSTKRGVLAEEIDGLIAMHFFQFDNQSGHWTSPGILALVSVGAPIIEVAQKTGGVVIGQYNQSPDDANVAFIPFMKKDRDAMEREWFQDFITPILDEMYCVNATLMLLNCKNIGVERHGPPQALNNKRIKRGRQPLFTYHTLVLKPVGKKQESIPKHLWNNRVHFQRGHFKTYTEEKPLFGHITGRFWWQSHVRGKNKDGIVMKDYVVEPV